MISRVIIAGGAVVLLAAGWVALQPTPPYVDYEPLASAENYYPVTPTGEVKLWYARENLIPLGRVLQAAEEPTIFYRTDGEAEWEIRFTLVPEYDQPVIVRIRPAPDGGYAMVAKLVEYDDEGRPLEAAATRVRRLDEDDVAALQEGLEALSFFDLTGPAPELEPLHLGWVTVDMARTEGDLWGIEWRRGHEEEDYHLVVRDSRVDLTGFEELALPLMRRAGFRPELAPHPVGLNEQEKGEEQTPLEDQEPQLLRTPVNDLPNPAEATETPEGEAE